MTQPPQPSLQHGDMDWPSVSAQNLARMWEHSVRAMGRRYVQWPDLWAADGGSPSPFPNSATLLRPLEESGVELLTRRLGDFYAAGQGGAWLLWSAWPTPDLSAHGFQLWGHPPLMVRPAGGALPEPPAELRIAEVVDDAQVRAFESVLANGYPVPQLQPPDALRSFDARVLGGPFRLWIGSVGDEAVTIAGAYMGERATGIYFVATLPQMRGKGYGAAITAQAVRAAPDRPAELQASEDGFPVYQRLGFEVHGEFALLAHPRAS